MLRLTFASPLLVTLLVNCGVPQDEHTALITERDALRRDLNSLETSSASRIKALQDELVARGDDLTRCVSDLQAAKLATNESSKRADELQAELSLYRLETEFDPAKARPGLPPLVAEYAQFVDLEVTDARYINTYVSGRVAGVRFKLRNRGVRTVKRLVAKVLYKNAADQAIGEEEFTLISPLIMLHNPGLLRPNYIMVLPGDRTEYLVAEQLSDDWHPGNVEAFVSELELE